MPPVTRKASKAANAPAAATDARTNARSVAAPKRTARQKKTLPYAKPDAAGSLGEGLRSMLTYTPITLSLAAAETKQDEKTKAETTTYERNYKVTRLMEKAIFFKPPYCSGTMKLPMEEFGLVYKKDGTVEAPTATDFR